MEASSSPPPVTANLRIFPENGDRYVWTTGEPYDGMNGRSATSHLARTPRTPLTSPCSLLSGYRSGSKGAFKLPGATWDHVCCTVEPSPGHIRCRFNLRYIALVCIICAFICSLMAIRLRYFLLSWDTQGFHSLTPKYFFCFGAGEREAASEEVAGGRSGE